MQIKNAGIVYQIINNIKISALSFHIMEYYPHCENNHLVSFNKLISGTLVSFNKLMY